MSSKRRRTQQAQPEGPWTTSQPLHNRCSICNTRLPDQTQHIQLRRTGPRGTPQPWPFCVRHAPKLKPAEPTEVGRRYG
jgi:hypothetical protein